MRRAQRGFTLIEVIFSASLLLIGVAGLISGLTGAKQAFATNKNRLQAIVITESVLESLQIRDDDDAPCLVRFAMPKLVPTELTASIRPTDDANDGTVINSPVSGSVLSRTLGLVVSLFLINFLTRGRSDCLR